MLDEILRSKNIKKSKNSLCLALNQSSQIAEFVQLNPPIKPKMLFEKFSEKLKLATTKVL